MKLVFLGPPGAGKGTQATVFSRQCNIPQLSTGDMLRLAVSSNTEIGKQAKKIIDEGGLVPDEIVNQIVFARLNEEDCADGYILDGYPRTVGQAEALDSMLASHGDRLDKVIELVVDPSSLIRRIEHRAKEAERSGAEIRTDDNVESFKRRLSEYTVKTAPLTEYYRRSGLLAQINGMDDIATVSRNISVILSESGAGNKSVI